MDDIRDCLRDVLDDMAVNKSKVARRVGLTPSKLSAILKKRRKLDANELINICAAIKITPEQLESYTQRK